MNKAAQLSLIILLVAGCAENNKTRYEQALVETPQALAHEKSTDTLQINASRSNIQWKGTKMRGLGKHEGIIQLQEGFFTAEEGRLTGGRVTVAMNTLQVTDIPESEPVPRKRFNEHMKSKDFFETKTYPTSTLQITRITPTHNDSLQVSGNLTLKNVTKKIRFNAHMKDEMFTAHFVFDRFQWNVGYQGNWADKTLVDRNIELRVKLFIQ